jgi:NAD(P)H-dependent FMN reductase
MRPTEDDPLVVALSGSLADESVTRLTVERALAAIESEGVETDLIDLRTVDLPMVDPDGDPPPDARRLAERIESADALVLGTPMYNGSYASPLKTAIDYADPESFAGLPVALVGVAGGQFPRRALDHLRAVMSHLDARVLPQEVAVPESYRVEDSLPEDVAERVDDLGHRTAGRTRERSAVVGTAVADD